MIAVDVDEFLNEVLGGGRRDAPGPRRPEPGRVDAAAARARWHQQVARMVTEGKAELAGAEARRRARDLRLRAKREAGMRAYYAAARRNWDGGKVPMAASVSWLDEPPPMRVW